jgi:prevent-host-death family protein
LTKSSRLIYPFLVASAEEIGHLDQVNVHEAKTHLSRLLERVERGEEIVIARAGKPVARLVPVEPVLHRRPIGRDKGRVEISKDFDQPLAWQVFPGFPPG